MSATKLLETIKQAATEAQGAGQPLNLCYGRVTSESPLNVLVDNKMQLSHEFLIVPEHLTDRDVDMTFDFQSGSRSGGSGESAFASHNHTISGKHTIRVHEALKSGDKVMLLRMQGGQSYLILCRL